MRSLLILLACLGTASARPLTAGEIALAKPIFRDSIDYTKVTVEPDPFPMQPANTYMTPRGHIHAPGALWEDDFSTGDAWRRATFIHEMTHVWQHARGMDLIAQSLVELERYHGDYRQAYAYDLVPGRDLFEYGMEQQAEIITDYVLSGRSARYASVLRKFLRDPSYARVATPVATR